MDRTIVLDPGFALAYALKAVFDANAVVDTSIASSVNADERDELVRNVRENAEKALSLDPETGSAHSALGVIVMQLALDCGTAGIPASQPG